NSTGKTIHNFIVEREQFWKNAFSILRLSYVLIAIDEVDPEFVVDDRKVVLRQTVQRVLSWLKVGNYETGSAREYSRAQINRNLNMEEGGSELRRKILYSAGLSEAECITNTLQGPL